MTVAALPVLLQYDLTLFGLGIMALLTGFLCLLCYSLSRTPREERQRNREGSSYRYSPPIAPSEDSTSEPEEEAAPASPSFSRSPSGRNWMAEDTASSPIGGTCLACGAPVTEETSASCPECGAERQRCPICGRYVAGGQDLLACIHCRTPGHANEMLAWVEQHETCPYCARRINRDGLRLLQELPRARRPKPQGGHGPQSSRDSTRLYKR
jgi:hypothetical protein